MEILSKEVIENGFISRRIFEGSEVSVKLETNDLLNHKLPTVLLQNKDEIKIVLGDADYDLDVMIEKCIKTCDVGEKSKFRIRCRDMKEIEFTIEVKTCSDTCPFFQWDDRQKLEFAKRLKAQGVTLFKKNEIKLAFYKFSKALKTILTLNSYYEGSLDDDTIDLFIALYNNLSNCQFHYLNYDFVIELCEKSLNYKPNVKGFYRRALANIELKNLEEAEKDLNSLLELQPTNKVAIVKKTEVKQKLVKSFTEHTETYQKMFS